MPATILPGETIGILGGGQLGRMLAVAAAQLGYRCHVYDPAQESVAGEVSAYFTAAGWHDAEAMARFAESCAVITYEFENVPVDALAPCPESKLAPGTRALRKAQDRLYEKDFAKKLGGAPAPYARIDGHGDLAAATRSIGVPAIVKTRRNGYDGKGQWRIADSADVAGIAIPESGLIYEGFVEFSAEFSVILVRGRDGEIRFWDSTQNVHEDGILARSFLPPAALVAEQVEPARKLARAVAEALDYVGVLTLEFFATENGPVFNEMAPRVHNSGHWTIEGAVTSQFENHIRAILGLPLGNTATRCDRVEMHNLIGNEAGDIGGMDIGGMLADPDCRLHLYGKKEVRAGRKMGHLTKTC